MIKSYLVGFFPRSLLISDNKVTLVVQLHTITIIELTPGVALIVETNELVFI